MTDSREQFEQWFKTRVDCYCHSLRRDDSGDYETSRVQLMWEAWTQSRAQPIRLPDAQCYVALDSIGKKNRVSGANDMRELCAGAIKAAGYTVE